LLPNKHACSEQFSQGHGWYMMATHTTKGDQESCARNSKPHKDPTPGLVHHAAGYANATYTVQHTTVAHMVGNPIMPVCCTVPRHQAFNLQVSTRPSHLPELQQQAEEKLQQEMAAAVITRPVPPAPTAEVWQQT
jgi:hypothetical protein